MLWGCDFTAIAIEMTTDTKARTGAVNAVGGSSPPDRDGKSDEGETAAEADQPQPHAGADPPVAPDLEEVTGDDEYHAHNMKNRPDARRRPEHERIPHAD